MSSGDTKKDADALQTEVQRQLGPAERLRIALEMSEIARQLGMARIRGEHPDWSGETVRRRFLSLLLPGAKLSRE